MIRDKINLRAIESEKFKSKIRQIKFFQRNISEMENTDLIYSRKNH